ncbi:MAG: F0F1 ATP synthase subunit delta [Burkholderia sp.]|nr:F0F1 ATP synthase subunit delta [Burkholderia sp.]
MVELATIARPYAEALFCIAEVSNVDTWNKFIMELSQIVGLSDVLDFISNPKISRNQITELLLATVKSPLATSDQGKNFLQILIENHRVTLIPEILVHFKALKNVKEGVADAVIVSAFPLESTDLEKLLPSLERRFKCKLRSTVKVDSSLIGGICVTVGNEVLDSSVRARLISMQTALAI